MWNAAILKKIERTRDVSIYDTFKKTYTKVGTVEKGIDITCITDDGPKPDNTWIARSSFSNEVVEFYTLGAAEFWLGVHARMGIDARVQN